jgi:hypothetical protein
VFILQPVNNIISSIIDEITYSEDLSDAKPFIEASTAEASFEEV